MFLGASNLIFEKAKTLRWDMTHAELILWSYLKQKPLGYKFRRQHPINIYVADFYCHRLKLIIEVDGSYHQQPDIAERDRERQKHLESEGMAFIRFTNRQIEKEFETVTAHIVAYMLQHTAR